MQLKLPEALNIERQRTAAIAVARALIPSTSAMEGANERTVVNAEAFISRLLPEALGLWRAAQLTINVAARAVMGKPLSELSTEQAEQMVERWTRTPGLGRILSALGSVYKVAHFDLPDTRGSLRSSLRVVKSPERERWEAQIVRGEDAADDDIECDVVIVGTGAGGAVVGRHLADRGHAVVFIEEGEHVRRGDFPGNFKGTMERVYRNAISVGNGPILVPQGKLVGGSTAVNTGTSFRPPRWITDRWCEEFGTGDFSTDALAQYFDRVESILQVEPADVRYAGPVYDIFRRGADRMGWHSETIRRNAPGCRGEGMCDNGCPTDARRSTLIAYLPGALERGNLLLSGLRADRVLMRGGRAVGIEATVLDKGQQPARTKDGRERRLRVRAQTVILAGGAMATPQFLLRQGIANSSNQVGRNLTLHPSGPSLGLFDEIVDADKYIPQTAYSHEFLHQGVMLLSAHADAHMMPATTSLMGRRLMQVFEQHRHLAGMGFLLRDSAYGRIRVGPKGGTVMTYNLTKLDIQRMQLAQVRLADLLLAAGAREVYPGVSPAMTIFDRAGVERLSQMKLTAGDFLLTSYHPLGTCRMSPDPRKGVVGTDHAVHDVPGLFIVDGSTVSGPLGVNPQITVMALATRAAEKIAEQLH